LGKKGGNVGRFGRSGFCQHSSETRPFSGSRPEKLRPHSDSQGSKFRPTGSQPNAKSGPKKCRLRDRIVDFDVPESDFRAAAQHGLMRGGGRPSTTSSRARRTPSRRHRGAPAEADQHYKLFLCFKHSTIPLFHYMPAMISTTSAGLCSSFISFQNLCSRTSP